MSATRTIFCPACGTRLTIPAATTTGKKARCGACTTTFLVPAALKKPTGIRTSVGQYKIADLPTDLREEIGEPDEEGTREMHAVPPESPRPPKSNRSTGEIERQAFDLDRHNKPRKQTGVKFIKVKGDSSE